MIDVDTAEGIWLDRCAKKLAARQPRLNELDARFRGEAPLPAGSENVREAYRRFQRKARTNFAQLIVEAVRERMTPAGFLVAPADDTGTPPRADAEARRIWDANNLDVVVADVFESMLALGDGYMIVGDVDAQVGAPVITGEDPRQVVTIHDPVQQNKVLAGLKMFHDPDQGRDLAYLYLPGNGERRATVHRAFQKVNRNAGNQRITFSPRTWDWDGEPQELRHTRVPVVRFRNRRGVGQFEEHTDLLDRIDHTILSRLVIAAMQAYRQMALKGDLPTHDEQGKRIDYNEMFVAGPGAFWHLPENVDIWESKVTDLTPIITSVKSDVELLSAVTRIPLAQFVPSATPQSAEGASLAREGLIFTAEDRTKRATEGLKDMMSLAFLTEGDDEGRANRSNLSVLWVPPERRSLNERADAASKAADIPWRTRMLTIWGYTPTEVDRMETERTSDALLSTDLGVIDAGSQQQAQAVTLTPEDIKGRADAMGVLIRSGVSPETAAVAVGLPGLEFTGAVPTTLRLPQSDAADLEEET